MRADELTEDEQAGDTPLGLPALGDLGVDGSGSGGRGVVIGR
jgi:hypothetical protein